VSGFIPSSTELEVVPVHSFEEGRVNTG